MKYNMRSPEPMARWTGNQARARQPEDLSRQSPTAELENGRKASDEQVTRNYVQAIACPTVKERVGARVTRRRLRPLFSKNGRESGD